MPTLNQIGSALKKAAAAGDEPAARALAKAYKTMAAQQQSSDPVPPSAAVSGGAQMAGPSTSGARDIEDQRIYDSGAPLRAIPVLGGLVEAATNPMLKKMLRPVTDAAQSFQSGAMQGMTLGFDDEINAAAGAPIRAGVNAATGRPVDLGQSFNQGLAQAQAADREAASLNPGAHLAGEITGGFVGPGKGLGLLKGGKSALGLAARGAAEGAATGGAYGFGSTDGNVGDRLRGALVGAETGGAFGAALPVLAKAGGKVVENVLQNKATNAAIKGAPDSSDLKSMSSQMFKSVDNSGVTIDTNKFSQFVNDVASKAKKDRINPTLDPKAHAAYEELIGALGDVQKNGASLSVSDLHTLRQIAQRASVSTEGRDGMFAQRIVDGLDKFVVAPGNLKFPPNRLGIAPTASTGAQLLSAISTWGRASRVGLIEDAIKAAQNYPSGVESGLRAQFKSLLNNKGTSRLFSEAERNSMQRVVNGTAPVAALRVLGLFRGLGGAALGGMFGGPGGAVAGAAIGMGGRKVTEMATEAAANRAAKIVATPNIPKVSLPNPLSHLSGVPFSLPLTDQMRPKRPLMITVNGGRG